MDGEVGNLFGDLCLAGLQLCRSGWGFREATKGDAEEYCMQVHGRRIGRKTLEVNPSFVY